MTTSRSDGASRSWHRRTTVRMLAVVVMLLVAVIGARLLVVRAFDDGPMPPSIARMADIPVTLADGRRSTLGALAKPGRPTVVSIWASWCGPCGQEAPVLADLRRRYGPAKLNLLYLNGREPGASRAYLAEFVKSVGMKSEAFAILYDAALHKLTNDDRNLIPRTYVFDRVGKPIAMIVSYKPLALARIEGLLG